MVGIHDFHNMKNAKMPMISKFRIKLKHNLVIFCLHESYIISYYVAVVWTIFGLYLLLLIDHSRFDRGKLFHSS